MNDLTTKTEKKKQSKPTVPTRDIDLGAVVLKVSEKWNENPWLTILWLKQADFAVDAKNYNIILSARLSDGGTRPQIGKSLKALDKKMDDHLSYVKAYITEKYKKTNATSYFPAFGIEYKDDRYAFPRDQNKRQFALDLMLDALDKNGFNEKEFGKDFWEEIRKNYGELITQATALDGAISTNVGGKNVLKMNLARGLNAIVHSIKSNYPDTYKHVLRDWGFQKEKY